ncbi:hypothetical protein AB0I28_37280 [Phytomonospora sp. NPDC050363]|uniref:Rv0361 family membrane protein n=1 Tax=Phytomonospora sp. NPDC050363 TaxID=3155642 RepID=UPI0033F5B112
MSDQPDEAVPGAETETVPEYAPEPQRSRKGLLIGLGAGAVAILVAIALLVVFVLDANGPSDVVDDYFGALKDADIAEARGYLCEAERVGAGEQDADAQAALAGLVAELEWEITGESVRGDTATVTVELKGLGEAGEDTVKLVTEAGDWKICGNSL